jgi:hypothetical protein
MKVEYQASQLQVLNLPERQHQTETVNTLGSSKIGRFQLQRCLSFSNYYKIKVKNNKRKNES